MTALAAHRAHPPFWLVTATAVAAWLVAWLALAPAVDWLVNDVLALDTSSSFGAAIESFLFDLPKAGDIAVWLSQAVPSA